MAANHSWTGNSVSGEARAHFGHQYVTNNIQVTAFLARDVYKSCLSTSTFRGLATDVVSFRSLLEFTEERVIGLNPKHQDLERIATVVQGCNQCLKNVETSVTKFKELPTQSQWTWERMDNMGAAELTELRVQLGTSIGLLSSLNTHLSTSSQEAVQVMLQKFIDKIRTDRRQGSVFSTQSVDSLSLDEREAWRIVRKELEDVGITPTLFGEHKAWITKTLKDAVESGHFQAHVLDIGQHSGEFGSAEDMRRRDAPTVVPVTNDPTVRPIQVSATMKPSRPLPVLGSPHRVEYAKLASRTTRIFNTIFPSVRALTMAAAIGDLSEVQKLLARKIDVNHQNSDGETALVLASMAGHLQVVGFLIAKGAKINATSHSTTALQAACSAGHKHVARHLIDEGADLEAKDKFGRSALACAAQEHMLSVVQLLISEGADLDSSDERWNTALIRASLVGHNSVAQILVENGANVEATNERGETPLIFASEPSTGSEECVRLLLDKGANINAARFFGETALIRACKYGNASVVQLLLQRGADIHLKMRSNGRTARDWALLRDRRDIVMMFPRD